MKTKTCLVLDAEKASTDALISQLTKIGLFIIFTASTIKEADSILKSERIDLVIADIVIGNDSGLDFLRTYPKLPPVIIASAHPEFAIATYEDDIIADFIQKPFTTNRLQKAINRALDIAYSNNFHIDKKFAFLKVSRKVIKFEFDNIDFIEAYGAYSKLYNKGQFHLVNESISTLENYLPNTMFKRVHKSYVINLNKITGYDHKYFIVDGVNIPIGASYKQPLQGLFKILGGDL